MEQRRCYAAMAPISAWMLENYIFILVFCNFKYINNDLKPGSLIYPGNRCSIHKWQINKSTIVKIYFMFQ
jgi:hypothetical protein